MIPWKPLRTAGKSVRTVQSRAAIYAVRRGPRGVAGTVYATIMALKEANQGISWTGWNRARLSRPRTIAHPQIHAIRILSRMAGAARDYACDRGIRFMGDIPIYVAHDSADVWAHPDLFQVDSAGHPIAVSGVPPDYFSATGQLWGNPLYRWDRKAADGFRLVGAKHAGGPPAVRPGAHGPLPRIPGFWEVAASEKTSRTRTLGVGAGRGVVSRLCCRQVGGTAA